MKCPHCSIEFHDRWNHLFGMLFSGDMRAITSPGENGEFYIAYTVCPSCEKLTIGLTANGLWEGTKIVYPFRAADRTAPEDVPEQLRADYSEAASILQDSPRASAAMSRRIIEQILRDPGGYDQGNLSGQIQKFSSDQRNPSGLRENLDYLREIGNFAAHAMKSTNTGEVLPVEPGEAEWALDAIDGLFDFYFVGPAKDAERRSKFDKRLGEAGRRPIAPD